MDIQVLIVGAGPSGLALANELALHQIPFRIIDQLPKSSTLSKAIAVQARTLELLARYRGMTEQFLSKGLRLKHGKIRSGRQLLAHIDLDQIPSVYPFVLSIAQYDTENILRENFTQATRAVEFGVTLTHFDRLPNGVKLQLKKESGELETLVVPWVAACDGAHSFFRETLNLPFEGSTFTEQRFMLADVLLNKHLDPQELRVFLSQGNILAIFPLPDQHFRLIAEQPLESASGELDVGRLQSLIHDSVDKNLKIEKVFWFSEFHINQRKIHDYRVDNIFFVGDAAHIHSPIGGQGMNTGIQDAINLGWKLAAVIQSKATPALLDTYNEEREGVAQKLLMATDLASRMMFAKNKRFIRIRNFFMKQLLRFSFIQKKILSALSEKNIHYRESALSEDHFLRNEGVLPGDPWPYELFPEASCAKWRLLLVDVDQEQLALLNQTLAPYSDLTCFVLTKKNLKVDAGISLIDDPKGAWSERLAHEHPALYLIRPDDYLAYRAQPIETETLGEYLQKWFQKN